MKSLAPLALFAAAIVGGWFLRTLTTSSPVESPAPSQTTKASTQHFKVDDLNTYHGLALLLDQGDPAAIEKAARKLRQDGVTKKEVWQNVLKRWFELSPQSASKFMADLAQDDSEPDLAILALQIWSELDQNSAYAAIANASEAQTSALIEGAITNESDFAFDILKNLGDTEAQIKFLDKNDQADDWLYQLATCHPTAAMAWAKQEIPSDFSAAILAGIATKNPQQAENWLTQVEDREEIIYSLEYFVSYSYNYEPTLMDFALGIVPTGNGRNELLQESLEHLAYRDPDLAITEAHRLCSDPHIQAEALARIASEVVRSDFEKAWEIVSMIDPKIVGIRRINIPQAEITSNGTTEKTYGPIGYNWNLTSMRGLVSPGDIKSQMLVKLLQVDQPRALAMMETLPPDQITKVGEYLIDDWLLYNPEKAITWLAARVPMPQDPWDVGDLSYMITESGASLAERSTFLQQLPPGAVRSALTFGIVEELGQDDPQAAIALAQKEGDNSAILIEAYENWSYQEPVNALTTLAEDQKAPDDAWPGLARNAFKEAPEQVVQLLNDMPDGQGRDLALDAISKIHAEQSSPLEATEWTLSIGDVAMREKSFNEILLRTTQDFRLINDTELADTLWNLIDSAENLPDEQRERWLQRVNLEFPTE